MRSRLARVFVAVMRIVRGCYFHSIGSILSKYTDDNKACTCRGSAVERQTAHRVVSTLHDYTHNNTDVLRKNRVVRTLQPWKTGRK